MKIFLVALACFSITIAYAPVPAYAINREAHKAISAPVDEVRTDGKDIADAPAADDAQAASDEPARPKAAATSYYVRPGDLLHVTVWKEEELDRDVLVLPDGTMDFPLIGSFKAEGKTTAQLQNEIKRMLKPYIPAASVTVIVKETRGNSISIIGQVARPGDVIMNRKMSVMQALSQVGGLTAYADDDIVILREVDGEEVSITFDYSAVSSGRKLDTNITLLPGDVIVVPTASLF
jgi:polysaccharide export outer membrane protein